MSKVVICDLKRLLDERGWDQKKLSKIAEIREATISEMVHNQNKMFPRHVIIKIAEALDINDINQLIRIVDESERPQ